MKKILIALLLAIGLIGCTDFFRDGLTGYQSMPAGESPLTLVLAKASGGGVYFKSDMFLTADSTATEYREVLIDDSLLITTLVSERDYKARISGSGRTWFSGYSLAGTVLTNLAIVENQGIWGYFSISPTGAIVQSQNNLADTVQLDIRLYGSGSDYYVNGTATDFDDLRLTRSDSGYFQTTITTLPGIQKYDFWGSGNAVDSVRVNSAVWYDISGGYVRLDVTDSSVVILDSVATKNALSFPDSGYAAVYAYVENQAGQRQYSLSLRGAVWQTDIILLADTTYLRLVADEQVRFSEIKVNDQALYHLISRNDEQYWFEFRLNNQVVIQAENNIFQNVKLGGNE